MTCRYDTIYYGGLEFDGFVTTSLNTERVPADDGFTTKYFKHTIECEFIITHETRKMKSVEGNGFFGVDMDLDYIRQVLMKPNQSLNFGFRGAGRGNIAGQWDSEFVTNLVPLTEGGGINGDRTLSHYGIGPIPEVLLWEPLANNRAARCKWRCVFFTSKASIPVINQSNPTDELDTTRPKTASEVLQNTGWNWELMVLSVVEEQEVDIDEEGYLSVTVKGVIEFSGERVKTALAHWAQSFDGFSNDLMEYWIDNPKCRKSVQQALAQYFEPYQPLGFNRKQRYVYNKENRKLEYVITDTEVKNPQARFPRIVSYTASHEVSSQLLNDDVFSGSGFLTWDSVFQGEFTVAPGYWMGWAWVAMMVIVKQRINRSIPFAGNPENTVKDDFDQRIALASQDTQNKERKKMKPKHLLTSVRVKENIHDRRVAITLRYLLMSDLNTLFRNSGLFTTVYSMFANDNAALNGTGTAYVYSSTSGPSDFGKTPIGNPRQWVASNRQLILEYQNTFLKKMSQNALAYNGLGLPDYSLIFDPDHLNLPAYSYDANIAPDVAQAENIAYTQDANPYVNEQKPNIYAARRRTEHWLEHPSHINSYRGEGDYIDSANNQPASDSPGASRNPQTTNQYPGATGTGMSNYIPFSDAAQTWIEYETDFQLIEKTNATYMQTIDAIDPATVKAIGTTTTNDVAYREHIGFTINASTPPSGPTAAPVPYTDGHVFAHGKPLYFIRFTGYAIRAGYQIPTPTVYGLYNMAQGGSPTILETYRVGTQYWNQKQLNKSCDIPLFKAEWDMMYAVKGNPTSGSIATLSPRGSEFM